MFEEPVYRRTLSELLLRHFDPPKWAIEGLLPEGLTVFAGKPKIGKSWMALDWGLAVAAGGDALNNYQSEPGDCLHIAYEDSERRMQDRVRKLGGHKLPEEALERFHYRVEFPELTDGGIDALDEWLIEHPLARLVTIDTFARFRGKVAGKDKYTEDYQAAGQIHSLAKRHGVAVVVVHHLRKESADDWLDRVSGTNGLTGAADTIAVLLRDRGKAEGALKVVGRDIEELDRAVYYNDGKWSDKGEASIYQLTVERQQLINTLRDDLGGRAKVSDLAVALDKTVATTSYLLTNLASSGHVVSEKYGVYALPNTPLEPLEVLEPSSSTSSTSSTSRGDIGSNSSSFAEDDQDFEPDPDDLLDVF